MWHLGLSFFLKEKWTLVVLPNPLQYENGKSNAMSQIPPSDSPAIHCMTCTSCGSLIVAMPTFHSPFLSILAFAKHSSLPLSLLPQSVPSYPFIFQVLRACSCPYSTSYCRTTLPGSLYAGKVPTVRLWPLLPSHFLLIPQAEAFAPTSVPRGALRAQELQLQSRVRAAVILPCAVAQLAW